MFGGTNNEGVWGFAALAQGVRGLGLGPNDVGQSRKPVDFGGWRGKVDDEPDSPEGKGAVPDDVPVVDEAQVELADEQHFGKFCPKVLILGRRWWRCHRL